MVLFIVSITYNKNVPSMYLSLLPDQLNTKNASKHLQKKEEDLQEDGPNAQELVYFHPKRVGHIKKTNIKEKLLITQTETFISTR